MLNRAEGRSMDDKKTMVQMGIDCTSISVIPHGVNVQSIHQGRKRRDEWRQKWKVSNKTVVFFHGTLHYAPNTDAVRFIAENLIPLVEEDFALDTVQFVITGLNPPRYYEHSRITFTGVVEDLAGHLNMADVFLCPLFDGGGTRLKLLEYLAVGKPILTTRKGAEGIPDMDQFTYVETAEQMFVALKEAVKLADPLPERQALAKRLSWTNVGQCYLDVYQKPKIKRSDWLY